MVAPQNIDDESFDRIVMQAKKPFLVDFWAPWCAPCRNIAPIVEELAKDYEGKVGFAKVNVDESSALATRYGVRSIPTLLFFKEGKPVNQVVGLRPKAELKKNLDALLTDRG